MDLIGTSCFIHLYAKSNIIIPYWNKHLHNYGQHIHNGNKRLLGLLCLLNKVFRICFCGRHATQFTQHVITA